MFHCQKLTTLRRQDRLKYPTLQNRNIYLVCAHVACFLSVCFARQTVRKSIAMNVHKPKGISLKIFKVYVNIVVKLLNQKIVTGGDKLGLPSTID